MKKKIEKKYYKWKGSNIYEEAKGQAFSYIISFNPCNQIVLPVSWLRVSGVITPPPPPS